MKLYLRTHRLWLCLEMVIAAILILIVWLDGYHNLSLICYSLLLVFIATATVILVDYHKNKPFYDYLTTGTEQATAAAGYLALHWEKLYTLEKQRAYESIQQQEHRRQDHVTFMNIWVHQMKTPLAVLELMADTDNIDSLELLEETDRLKDGLQMALTYTRLEEFTEDFVLVNTSLLSIVKEAISDQKRSFIRHEVFPAITSEKDFNVTTDTKWLKLILHQLLSNAIKYSYAGAAVSCQLIPEKRQLIIADTGCGIPASDLPRVRRPFFTGTNGRTAGEATGMGLYLAEEIGQQLDIELAIASVINKGTCVTLQFSY